MQQKIRCPFCLEKFSLEIYPEDGDNQDLTYDCEICCHPIDIGAHWNEDLQKFTLDIRRSTGFSE